MKGDNRTKRMLGGVVRSARKGDYERAVRYAEEAHQADPSEETELTLNLVSEFASQLWFRIQGEDAPRSAKSLKSMGNEYYDASEYRSAAACYGMAMVISPKDPNAFYNRALALCRLDQHKAAIATIDTLLKLAPDHGDGYYLKGVAHESMGDHVDASIAYLTAMKLKPDFKEPSERLPGCVKLITGQQWNPYLQTDLLTSFACEALPVQKARPDRALKDHLIAFNGGDQATCEVTSSPLAEIPMEDVILSDAVAGRIRDMLVIVRHPEIAKRHSLAAPVGILMAGPPGTGKTYCAQAIAGELGWNLVRIDYRTVGSMWSSNTERNLSQAYTKIITGKLYPAIVLHDELDSLGFSRATDMQAYEVSRVNALIQNVDRLTYGDLSQYPVKIAATTNLKEAIDPALLRSGRLVTIDFGKPDLAMRERLFKVHFRGVGGDLDFARLAKVSEGRTGADIHEFARETKLARFRSEVAGRPVLPLTTADVAAIVTRGAASHVPGYG